MLVECEGLLKKRTRSGSYGKLFEGIPVVVIRPRSF